MHGYIMGFSMHITGENTVNSGFLNILHLQTR